MSEVSDPVGELTVRYYAGARAAAGVAEERLAAGVGLDELTDQLAARHGDRLSTVLKAASLLVDGRTWHDRQTPLPVGATVEVLPPFAGG